MQIIFLRRILSESFSIAVAAQKHAKSLVKRVFLVIEIDSFARTQVLRK
jgi:hypothetical protein